MKELIHEPSHHRLLEDESGALHLEVECGTTAIFLLTFSLNDEERKAYATQGAAFIKQLAWQVSDQPDSYLARSK